jgi:hypothetical protein
MTRSLVRSTPLRCKTSGAVAGTCSRDVFTLGAGAAGTAGTANSNKAVANQIWTPHFFVIADSFSVGG